MQSCKVHRAASDTSCASQMSQKSLVVAAAAGFVAGATLSGVIAFFVMKWKKGNDKPEYPRRKDVFRQGEGIRMCLLCSHNRIAVF
jgi:hypothetical protein